ncbi:MAG: hypothetical protein JSW58_15130 [Candidatus Latescibacterota bacterium]|nr:MAG: hypothetical protein JSW58_15130 [Candidatus Latescibacterota bacterium]
MTGHHKRLEGIIGRPIRTGLLLLAVGLFALSSCSDDDPAEVEVVVPQITALSDSTLSPGDTLVITGKDFATPASQNIAVFNNSLGIVTPFFATGVRMDVVVPANANAGPMHVRSNGVKSNTVDVTIEREIGDVWVMGGGASYEFEVPVATGSEKYLVVAQSATSTGGRFDFQVTPGTSSASPQPDAVAVHQNRGTPTLPLEFEVRAREEAVEYLRKHGSGKKDPFQEPQKQKSLHAAPPPTATFLVINCTDPYNCSTLQASNFSPVTADLRYEGTRALIYSDVNQPTGSFQQQDYDAFGQQFDNEIYPINTANFGTPTDIDSNGRVVILFTPRVNDLTPDGQAGSGFISGFVLLNDVGPGIFPSGTSNAMEIFYSMVPDPNGEYGNVFPMEGVRGVVPGTLAHEFEHMISNGYRFVVLGTGTDPSYIQQTWLEEGMAHMAEDLNGMDSQNIARASRYLAVPSDNSLLGNAELQPYIDTLEQRGGIYLFLRYLGDQLGEGIYRDIVRSKKKGIASVEGVTDESFHTSMGDFLATLYLSDRGITGDPTYNYSSFDLQNDFGPLTVTGRDAGEGMFAGAVRSAAGDYYVVSGAQPPALQFGVATQTGSLVRIIVVRTE